jgi:undecaprenyl-diphosphatase
MPILKAIMLAIVQGLTELLPVSSSAHVIVAARLLHEDMSTPANALLLVMLHTGTMFAVIVYFWRRWMEEFLSSWSKIYACAKLVFVSSLFSGLIFLPTEKLVTHILSRGTSHVDIEALFNKLNWIAPALAAVGILIIYAGLREARRPESNDSAAPRGIRWLDAIVMGILQGLAIPFRGFSRSGCTISGGLLAGGRRSGIESYSFAMVVAITPLALAWEVRRVYHRAHLAGLAVDWSAVLGPGLVGGLFAFLAGLLALRWLSRWLQQGRWYWFGIYCFLAAVGVELLYLHGW